MLSKKKTPHWTVSFSDSVYYSVVCHVWDRRVEPSGRISGSPSGVGTFTKRKGAPLCQLAVGSSGIIEHPEHYSMRMANGECTSPVVVSRYWGRDARISTRIIIPPEYECIYL